MQAAANPAMPRTARATIARSDLVCALMADVPSHASTGVRNQNSDIAATMKSVSAPPLFPARTATIAPVASGTSIMPHAPCSRGTDHGFEALIVYGSDVGGHDSKTNSRCADGCD